jgi:hypothetical protein
LIRQEAVNARNPLKNQHFRRLSRLGMDPAKSGRGSGNGALASGVGRQKA